MGFISDVLKITKRGTTGNTKRDSIVGDSSYSNAVKKKKQNRDQFVDSKGRTKEQAEWEKYAEEQRRKDDELRAQREQEHNAMLEDLRRQQEEQQEYFRQQQAKNDQYVKDQQAIHDQYQQRAAQQKAADEAYDSMWSKDYMEQQRKQHDQYVKDQQAIHDSYAQQAAARKAADDAYDAMWSKDYMEQQRKQHDQQVQDQKTLHDYYAQQAAAKKAADDAYDAMWSKDYMDEQRRLDDERTEQRRMENEAARKQMEWKQYLAQLGNAGKDEKALMRAENAYLSAADSERKLAGEGTDEELPRGTAFGQNDLQTAYGLGQKQIDADRQKRAEAQGLLGYEGIKKNSTDESGKFTYTVADQKRIQAERDKARAAGYYDGSIDPSMLSDEALALFPEAMKAEADKKQKSAEQMAEDFEARTATKAWEEAYDFIDKIELRTKGASRAERVGRRKDNIENADNYFRYSFDQDVFMLQDDPQVMREALYNDLMSGRTSYAEITANMTPEEKTQLDGMLDNVLEEAFKNYGTWDAQREGQYEGLIKESWAYGGKIAEAQQEQENRQKIKSFSELAATAPTNGDYDPELRPEPKLTYNSSADTYIYEPQGTELEKAYFSMNEYTDDDEQGYGHVVNKYVFASDEQKALFNTLYKWDKQNGTNYAGAYLEGLDNYLQAMLSEYQDTVIRMQAEDPVLGTANRILSYPENVIGGFAGMAGAGAALLGVESAKDKNSNFYLTSKMVQTTREQQNENMDKWAVDTFGDWAKGKVKFLANVVDSIGDNLFAMGTANMMTGNVASKAGMRLVQLIMSGEATSNTMLEKLDAHMDPTEAALYSIGDGIIEWITEKWSLEALLKPDVKGMLGNKKQLATFLAKTAAAEGSEEIASDLLNMCLDKVLSNIYGHEDELKKRYDELVVGGMTDTEATKAVLHEKFNEVAMSGLAGAISGGIMGGGRVVSNTITQNRMGRNINQVNSYTDQNGTNQLIEKAKALGGESQSARMAAELEEKISKGQKISDKTLGKLAQNIQMESQDQAASKEKEILQDAAEKELRDKGFKAQEAKDMAELIVRQQTEGMDSLSRKERMMLQESPTANQVIKDLNGETELSERVSKEIGEQTKVYDDAAQAATNLMRGRTAEGIDVRTVGKQLATQDEIDRAEGKRTKSPREVIVDREFGELEGMARGRMEDGKFVPAEDEAEPNRDDVWKYAVKVNGKTKYVDATDIKGTNFSTAAVIRDQAMDPYVYSGRYTNLLIDQIEKGNIQNVGRYLSDAYRIRWAAYTGKEMPQTGIAEEAAREIYRLSQMDKIDERKAQKEQANFKGAGNGTATFKDAEYGTQEFEDAIRDLDQKTQDRIRFVADWAKTYGIDIQFADLNDTKNPWMHGSESSKGIMLNLESYDNKANQAKGIKHNIVATLGHEATHWLQRNNAAAYYELEEFVLNKMQAEGYDVAQRAQEIMESRRKHGQNISMTQAIDEIVANACDQVLGNPETVNELKKQHGKLYTKLKEYVNRLIDRIKSVTADLGESASIDAQRIMYKYGNELAKLWNGAMDEVLTGKIRQLDQAEAKEPAPAKEAAPAADSVAENFSMAEPVEQTRDLIAVHNLGANELMKVINLGGFAMPSIAIVRNNYAHNRYGDVSVLFYKDTIDPKRSTRNKVYGGDAWTPTYPSVEYKVSEKKLKEITKKINQLVPDNLRKSGPYLYYENVQNDVNGARGDIVQALKRIDDLKLAYLFDKGADFEVPTTQKRLDGFGRFDNEQVLHVLDMLGADTVRDIYESRDYGDIVSDEELNERIRKDLNDQFREKHKDSKLAFLNRDFYEKEKFGSKGYNLIEAAYKYLNNGIEEEIDQNALNKLTNEKIDQADYEKWLANLLDGLIEKTGIRNNKSVYTDYGNRRSWEQLHDEETLENVVKIMKAEADKGANTFFNQSAILALGTRNMRSINEIRQHKGQLQHISDEEMSAAKTDIVDRFGVLADQLSKNQNGSLFEQLEARDKVREAIVDAVRHSRTVDGIMRVMKEWYYDISREQAQEIVDLMNEISELPTEYFEAKPQRAVGLDEIAKVVLPKDTDQKLIDALEKNGVTYEFYDGTDEDRLAKMNDDSIMFSMAEDDAADIGVWMMSLTPSSVHTEGERALIQEYRGLKTTIDLTRKKLIDYRDQLKRLQKKGGMLTADERKTMTELEARIQTNEEKMARLEQELYEVTRGEGYAAMMYRNSQIYKDHIEGKSQIQVEAAVDQLMSEVEDANKEIGARQKVLNRMSEESAVKTVRRELRNRGLKQNAAALKDGYFTTMSNAELEARLAEIVVKAVNGEEAESIKTAIDSLAADIVNSPVSRMAEDAQDALRPLKGRTVTFGPSEQAELKAIGYTLAEIRSMTKGSGITFKFGENSTLQGDLEEIAKEAPAIRDELMDKSTSAEQAAVVLVDWVAGKMKDMKGNPKDFNFDTKEVSFVVLACMQQMLNENQGGMTRAALRKKIDTAAGEIGKMADAANSLMETVQKIRQNAIKASNAAGGLRGDMAAAVDYYNLIARQAAEVERARVKRDVIEKLRSENTKKLIEQQQKYQEMMKKDRRARELQKDNESLRKVITTDAKRLKDRLVAETDQKNIPEEAKPLARMLVSMLVNHDMADWRRVLNADKKMLADVQTRLAKMDEMNGTFDMDADLDWLVIKTPNPEDYDYSIRDSVLVDLMNIEQGLVEYRTAEGRGNVSLQDRKNALDKIQKAVSEIYDVIKARETAFIQGQKWQVIELAEQMEKDMENSRFKGERTGKIGKAVDSFWRAVGYGNLTPEYFIKNLKNRTMSMLHRGMHEAEQQSGLQALAAKKRLEQIAKDTGYATWDGQQKHQVKLENGKVIEMSTEQIMSLYATWNREKNQLRPEETAHLLHGGFVLAKGDTTKGVYGRDQTKQRPTRMSENDLNSLGGYLTDQQKAWVDKIVEYMSTDMAKIGNEASMKAYGIKKFTEKYYFPIKSWGGVLNKSSSSGVNNQNENRAMRQSFSRRVMNNARNAIEIGDFTATAMKHITGMITFNTVGPAVENLNKVLNQQLDYNDSENMDPDENYKRNMRAAFVENYGQAAYDYLTQFMKDVNGGVGRRIETSMREKLLSMFKKNAVAGSLSVAAQQPLSYIRAAMLINPKYLAAAISPQYWKGSYQEMLEHSGLAVIKDMGKFDMNFGQSMTDYITPDGMKSKKEKVNDASEKLTSLPGKMDAMTWTRMWSAVKLEQAALHQEMDVKSEEFLDMVADRFNELMRRTQVYDSVMVKSQNMRSDSYLKKVTTSFMAEPTLSLNVLADAWMNMKEKGGKANAAKALATFILSAAAQAGAKAFFGTGRSPDKKKTEEENFLNKFLQNLLGEANPFGLIPGYSQLVEVLINGELNDDAMGMIGKATDAVQKIFELATGDIGKKGLYRDLEDSIGQVVQLATDVPLKNVMRDFRAMVNWFSGGQSTWTGDQFAQRETSAAVLKMQSIETLMTKELGGIWNKALEMLGNAGYKTDNTSYVRRIYEAQKKGNETQAAEIREYMEKVKLNGSNPGKWIDSQLNAMLKEDDSLSTEEKMDSLGENGYGSMGKYINDQYRAGEIDRKTAEEYYRKENPTATDKDVAKFLDKTDWEKDGKPLAEGQKNYTNYTPLYVAMQDNKVEDIRDAVEHMKEIGYTEKDIKKEVNGEMKKRYMAADANERIRLKDAMEKAYKALGFTAEDADKTIRNWTKEKKEGSSAIPGMVGVIGGNGMSDVGSKKKSGNYGKGNINLDDRPIVVNKDGSISTERSFSFWDEDEQKEILIPTVINGKIVSERKAIDHYYETGEYLGKFDTWQEADEYAEQTHSRFEIPNEDGTPYIANYKGKRIVLDSVIDGEAVSFEEAFQWYLESGDMMASFKTYKEAQRYVKSIMK